ncbi:fructosamine kinase family protein [Thiolapillus sp.]|uniref:fructosamine kinase family protein n=1 Tax=Thiolapillus sp. TaxID=2017437 RepID=UPI003AF969E0
MVRQRRCRCAGPAGHFRSGLLLWRSRGRSGHDGTVWRLQQRFGGFSSDFYAAYKEACPLDPGYAVRKALYNLYHVLNHLNLFGGGYRGRAEALQEQLLAELG